MFGILPLEEKGSAFVFFFPLDQKNGFMVQPAQPRRQEEALDRLEEQGDLSGRQVRIIQNYSCAFCIFNIALVTGTIFAAIYFRNES